MASVSTTSSPNSGTIDGWTERSLGDIALVTMGQSPPSSAYNTDGVGLPLIQGNADIKNRKTIVRSWSSKWSKECRQGDIVMTVRAPVGSVAVAQSDVCLGRGVCALSPTINAEFLYHALVHREAEWSRLAQGSTFTAANGDQVRGFSLLIPNSIEEQRRIAEVLTDTDYLIDGLERLITKKRNVMKGAAQALLAGGRRLPGFNDEWRRMNMEELVEVDPENLSAGTDSTFLFNYVSLEDVSGGRLNSWSEMMFRSAPSRARRVVCEGDVLFGTVRPNLQSHCIVPRITGDWVASTGFAVLRAKDDVDPHFVFHQLFTADVSGQIDLALTGSNYPAISSREVRKLVISVPRSKEQRAIAEVLTDMDAEIEALEKRLAKTRDLKTGMAQELLSGRTRLV